MLRGIEGWWSAYDRYLTVATRGLGVRCRAGCSLCCAHGPQGVSGVEALLVLRAVQALPDGAAVMARLQQKAARFQARVDSTGSVAGAAEATGLDPDPCAFLDQEGRCRVYAARPVACRMFFAITPPERCDHRHPRHAEAVNPHLEPPHVLMQILLAISQRLGLDDLPRDLWRAVAAVEARWPPA